MRSGLAPHWFRVMIAGRGAVDRESVVAVDVAPPSPGIGRAVGRGGPPNAVPSVLMNTTRGADIVVPAGRWSDRRRQRAVSVHSGSVACRPGWNSGDPASGPASHVSSST